MGFDLSIHARTILVALAVVAALLTGLAMGDQNAAASRAAYMQQSQGRGAGASVRSQSTGSVTAPSLNAASGSANPQGELVAARSTNVDSSSAAPIDSGEGSTASAPRSQPPAERECARDALIVDVPRSLPIRSEPGSGSTIGTIPAASKYMGTSMKAWVRTTQGRYGMVSIPWAAGARTGWIDLRGLHRSRSPIRVEASLSKRRLQVFRGCRAILTVPTAVGAADSPSPRGRFWVTDPTPVPASQPQFGSYAFGLSTIQPNLPAGWTGGNQMAIHGTNAPSTIGTAASAGCLRVSESTLSRLRELLVVGTPVTIRT